MKIYQMNNIPSPPPLLFPLYVPVWFPIVHDKFMSISISILLYNMCLFIFIKKLLKNHFEVHTYIINRLKL
jgi:hypothetical protein